MVGELVRTLVRLVVLAAFISGSIYTWKHFHQAPAPPVAEVAEQQAPESNPNLNLPEAQQAHQAVKFAGPLADLMAKASSQDEEPRRPYKPSAEDHIEDSPVGTSTHIVHKTFAVARAVHVPFEIPPHAATPRFHGTFRSFAPGGAPSSDESANVDLLLMNEEQFAEFAAGREPDVLFVADTSHYQDVNFDLSPSRDLPVKYHLVFRNTPGGAAKKLVQADFTVDF